MVLFDNRERLKNRIKKFIYMNEIDFKTYESKINQVCNHWLISPLLY